MYPLAAIDEIFQVVLANVKARVALRSLALSCRAFYDPAMDVLWCDLEGLQPLVRCLPSHMVRKVKGTTAAVKITRRPLQADWSRFLHHSRRVRSLQVHSGYGDDSRYDIDYAAFEILRQYHPGLVLPNLQHLVWSDNELAPFATLFVTPSLLSLVFKPVENLEIEDVRAILAEVRGQASELQLLKFPEADLNVLTTLKEEISATVCALTNLTTLDFSYAHLLPDAFIHLSRLPKLTSLTVSLTNRNGDCWKSAGWGGFSSLEMLGISSLEHHNNLSYPLNFLNSINVAKLTEVEMISDIPAQIDDVAELFSSLGRFSKLRQINLVFCDDDDDDGRNGKFLRGSAILPLTSLRSMTVFCAEQVSIDINRAEIRELTESWPHLQSFTLLPAVGLSYSRLQLEDLALFAKHCPNIKYLNVELESPRAGWRYTPDNDRLTSNLPCLCLSRSHISASVIEPVAEFLADIFPLAKVSHDLPGWHKTPEDEEAARVLNKIWKLKEGLNFPPAQQQRREQKKGKGKRNRRAKRTAAE